MEVSYELLFFYAVNNFYYRTKPSDRAEFQKIKKFIYKTT